MLGWLLNLGFAGGGEAAEVPAMPGRRSRWVAAVVVAHGVAAPAGRARWASYGAGVTTRSTPKLDVEVMTEAQLQTADPRRVKITLTRFTAGTPIPGHYRVISESTGETDP